MLNFGEFIPPRPFPATLPGPEICIWSALNTRGDHLLGCPQVHPYYPPGPDSRKITCFDFTEKGLLFLLEIMIVIPLGA